MSGSPVSAKPQQTQASVRHYANGHYGPQHTESIAAAPAGKGGVLAAYGLLAGHRFAFIVAVSQANQLMDYFKFANETNKNEVPLRAVMTRDREGRDIIDTYEGRETATDYAFGQYVVKGTHVAHSGATHEVDPPQFWLQVDAPDGRACEVPLWHQGSN